MFGLRNDKPDDPAHPAGRLDRLARRKPAETQHASDPAANRDGRLAAAIASLSDAVGPKLREALKAGAATGEITR